MNENDEGEGWGGEWVVGCVCLGAEPYDADKRRQRGRNF